MYKRAQKALSQNSKNWDYNNLGELKRKKLHKAHPLCPEKKAGFTCAGGKRAKSGKSRKRKKNQNRARERLPSHPNRFPKYVEGRGKGKKKKRDHTKNQVLTRA